VINSCRRTYSSADSQGVGGTRGTDLRGAPMRLRRAVLLVGVLLRAGYTLWQVTSV
jgi:hypothetical protein